MSTDPDITAADQQTGANIKAARTAAGLSQEKFGRLVAKLAGRATPIAPTEVSRWESGKRTPGRRNRIAIARALNLPLSFLDEEAPQ